MARAATPAIEAAYGGLLDPPATDGGDPDAVPEPATLALLGLGVAGLAARRRRQHR